MKTINLRWIYPHYRHDEFVEVSDEVWEAMRQAQREMNNYERRKVYHRAYYSLDAYSWTENYALEHGRSPEDISVKVSTGSAQIKGHTEPALPTSKFSGQNGRMTKTVRRNQGQLGLALQGSE